MLMPRKRELSKRLLNKKACTYECRRCIMRYYAAIQPEIHEVKFLLSILADPGSSYYFLLSRD